MIKKVISIVTVMLLAVFMGGVKADQVIAGGMSVADGDPNAGKSKSELCHGCHGVNGISVDPTTFPNLAGQFAGYIFKQVQDFQLGNRHDDTMSAMAATVTSLQDLKDIAVYFSKQKTMKGKPTGSAAAKTGDKIFHEGVPQSGVYGCINCHGKDGKGRGKGNSLFPVIGGQQKAYLVKQLKDFKGGKRKNDPAGMMSDIAKKLSDEQINAVAEYLSGL